MAPSERRQYEQPEQHQEQHHPHLSARFGLAVGRAVAGDAAAVAVVAIALAVLVVIDSVVIDSVVTCAPGLVFCAVDLVAASTPPAAEALAGVVGHAPFLAPVVLVLAPAARPDLARAARGVEKTVQ